MMTTTAPTIEDRPVREPLGIVTGEAIMGANLCRDLFAGVRGIVGGRSASHERVLGAASKPGATPPGEPAASTTTSPRAGTVPVLTPLLGGLRLEADSMFPIRKIERKDCASVYPRELIYETSFSIQGLGTV